MRNDENTAGRGTPQQPQGQLSPKKTAQCKTVGRPMLRITPRRAGQAALPASPGQERIWFLEEFEPGSAAYHRPASLRLTGPLNPTALESSLSEIVRRHEALRTTFSLQAGGLLQAIHKPFPVALEVLDLSGLSEEDRAAQAHALAVEEARTPFDLANGPLLRARLLRMSAEEYILLLTLHHIVFDGWSMGVLMRELAALYDAYCTGGSSPLPELPIQYPDFALWQHNWLQGEACQEQLSYWLQQLGGDLPVLDIATDRPRPEAQTFSGARKRLLLSKRLTEEIKALGRRENATLFMTLLAAFNVLLYRYTGQQDIMVGCPVSGRNRLEVETLIGLFINTLVLRTNLSGDLTFRDLLAQVREVVIGALTHQELPFQKLIEELQPERDPSRTPLFQVLFQLRNVPARVVETGDLRLEEFEFDSGTARFDLSLDLVEEPEGLLCVADYNTDLFDGATISRLLEHFRQLLDEIVTDPERRIGQLPMLTKAERHQLLVEWNQTEADYPRDKCIHELFEAQAEKEPAATALVFGTERWTYHELNRRANQVAHYLRSLGVGPDIPVGIAMERSADMVVVMLGILKAGGAYVALDPSYPAGRLQFILADTGAPVLVTQQRLAQKLSQHSARSVFVDQVKEILDTQPDTNPVSQVTPDHLAYVVNMRRKDNKSR